jgi:hypothetical protein
MNSLINNTKLIETTKLNTVKCGAWGVRPDLPYTGNDPSCKFLADKAASHMKRYYGPHFYYLCPKISA